MDNPNSDSRHSFQKTKVYQVNSNSSNDSATYSQTQYNPTSDNSNQSFPRFSIYEDQYQDDITTTNNQQQTNNNNLQHTATYQTNPDFTITSNNSHNENYENNNNQQQINVEQQNHVSNNNNENDLSRPKLTVLDASWNIANAIQGMFVLSLPWAVYHGGFIGVFLIVVTAIVCSYTGRILVDCLYQEKPDPKNPSIIKKSRIYGSYQEVAVACLGPHGKTLVNVSQAVELLMICILYVVVSGDLIHTLCPKISKFIGSFLVSLVLLPCAGLKNLKTVSRFSCLCSIGQFLVYAVIIWYCLETTADRRGEDSQGNLVNGWWLAWSQVKFYVEWREFSIGIGAIVFSYTSQFYLPALEADIDKF